MTTRSLTSLAWISTLCAFTASATAEQYWIAYEGNDFPENEGWERHTYGGGAERWLEDGVLVIDTTADLDISEAYIHSDMRWPGPGETFIAEWRLLVDESLGFHATDVIMSRPAPPGDLTITHSTDEVRILSDGTTFDIAPGVFHSYRIESEDMDLYRLFVDGVSVYEGYFQSPSILDPFLAFGEAWHRSASLSRWDYVRFGIVPEPTSLTYSILAALVLRQARPREWKGGHDAIDVRCSSRPGGAGCASRGG